MTCINLVNVLVLFQYKTSDASPYGKRNPGILHEIPGFVDEVIKWLGTGRLYRGNSRLSPTSPHAETPFPLHHTLIYCTNLACTLECPLIALFVYKPSQEWPKRVFSFRLGQQTWPRSHFSCTNAACTKRCIAFFSDVRWWSVRGKSHPAPNICTHLRQNPPFTLISGRSVRKNLS